MVRLLTYIKGFAIIQKPTSVYSTFNKHELIIQSTKNCTSISDIIDAITNAYEKVSKSVHAYKIVDLYLKISKYLLGYLYVYDVMVS